MFTYDHNGKALDFATFPQASQIAMARRGLTHFLGSEMASKVTSWKESETKARAEAAKAEGAAPAQPISDEEIAAKRAEFNELAYKALAEGTVGVRATGSGSRVSRDPLQAEIWKQAKEEITNVLLGQGFKLPKGEDKLEIGGKAFTGDELVERWLAGSDPKGWIKKDVSVRDRITKAATKRLADKAGIAARVKEQVAGSPGDDLGF